MVSKFRLHQALLAQYICKSTKNDSYIRKEPETPKTKVNLVVQQKLLHLERLNSQAHKLKHPTKSE